MNRTEKIYTYIAALLIMLIVFTPSPWAVITAEKAWKQIKNSFYSKKEARKEKRKRFLEAKQEQQRFKKNQKEKEKAEQKTQKHTKDEERKRLLEEKQEEQRLKNIFFEEEKKKAEEGLRQKQKSNLEKKQEKQPLKKKQPLRKEFFEEEKKKAEQAVRKRLPPKLIDSMENMDLWFMSIQEHTLGRIALFRGVTGKGLAMYFDLPEDGWITITRPVTIDMSPYAGVRFSFYGTGSSNSLVVSLRDTSGAVKSKTIKSISTSGASWEMETVLFETMDGTSKELKNIQSISFSVRKNTGDTGGKGRIVLDNLELVQ